MEVCTIYITKNNFNKNNKIITILALWFLINITIFPKTAIDGATKGLTTWFNIVIPSLLPFFIISEILIELGFVEYIGTLLEPIMIPIFNVSGMGAFPFALSVISGYPVGVKLVSKLRQKNNISKNEAERLLSFSSTSGPLFMLGAVSTGMLKEPALGSLIIYPHYLAALSLGILFRFYKKHTYIYNLKITNKHSNTISSKNNLNIGLLLSNSIKNSTSSIITIGGFMLLYSVLLEILYISKSFNLLIKLITYILPFNINSEVIKSFLSGIVEITIGCSKIAETNIPLPYKIFIINFFIGWSGLSIHSQALSFLSKTDINSKLYIFTKFLHGLLSTCYSYILYKILYNNLIFQYNTKETFNFQVTSFSKWINILALSTQNLIYVIIVVLISAVIINITVE